MVLPKMLLASSASGAGLFLECCQRRQPAQPWSVNKVEWGPPASLASDPPSWSFGRFALQIIHFGGQAGDPGTDAWGFFLQRRQTPDGSTTPEPSNPGAAVDGYGRGRASFILTNQCAPCCTRIRHATLRCMRVCFGGSHSSHHSSIEIGLRSSGARNSRSTPATHSEMPLPDPVRVCPGSIHLASRCRLIDFHYGTALWTGGS